MEKLGTMPWEAVTKNREASHYSMKNILLHMIDDEDWIENWVIRNKSLEYQRVKWETYTDMRMIMDHLEKVEKKTKAYLEKADDGELQRRVNFTISSGAVSDLSVEESLFQSFIEQLYHPGELIVLLWQENIEPPTMQCFWNNPRAQSA